MIVSVLSLSYSVINTTFTFAFLTLKTLSSESETLPDVLVKTQIYFFYQSGR